MTEKEWSEYFEFINGRKPSEKEFSTAKAEGKFNTEELPPADTAFKQSNQKKKKRWLLPTIIVAAVLISAAVGTFAYLKLTANPFDGTWYSKDDGGYSRLTFKGNKIELLDVWTPQTTSYDGSINVLRVASVVLNTQDKTVQIDTGRIDTGKNGGRYEKHSGTFSENDEELQVNTINGKETFILSKDKTELQLKSSGGSISKYYKSDTSQAGQGKSFFEKYSSQIQQLKKEYFKTRLLE